MKKLIMSLFGILVGVSAHAASMNANNSNAQAPAMGEQGFAVGIYNDSTNGGDAAGYTPYVQGFYDWFNAGIGANYSDIEGKDGGTTNLLAHAGFRMALDSALYLNVGAKGSWTFFSGPFDNNWLVGAYAGFDYFLSDCVLVDVKIMPYAYKRLGGVSGVDDSLSINQVFTQGSIGMSYVF